MTKHEVNFDNLRDFHLSVKVIEFGKGIKSDSPHIMLAQQLRSCCYIGYLFKVLWNLKPTYNQTKPGI
jgi:hypothetical protein